MASKDVGRTRFDFAVPLPARDVGSRSARWTSAAAAPRRRSAPSSRFRRPPSRAGRREGASRIPSSPARSARWRARSPASAASTCRTCAPAPAPPGTPARFPAASTVKVAIAIEVLRRLGGKPPRGSRLDALLRKAIIPSDDRAANDLLTWLGGSTSGGAAYVNQLFRALGMDDTDMYGGYIITQDPDPDRRSAELRRQADDGGRPRDAHALAEPRGGRAGPAGSAWLPAVAGSLPPLPARALAGEPDRPVPASGPDRGAPEGRLDQHRPARHRPRLLVRAEASSPPS